MYKGQFQADFQKINQFFGKLGQTFLKEITISNCQIMRQTVINLFHKPFFSTEMLLEIKMEKVVLHRDRFHQPHRYHQTVHWPMVPQQRVP